MTATERTELAVLGAGPIGVEAALRARREGWDVRVYERDEVGAHIRRWGHVEFFSPWRLNRSPWGEETLDEIGARLADDEAYPTGEEYLERYLRPLADAPALDGRIETGCTVEGISRRGELKTDDIGSAERADEPFVLRLDDGSPRYAQADRVIDATGVYRTPNGLGPGGLRAVGERTHADRIDYYIPDPEGADREAFAGRRTLVVGAGYSAVTSLKMLQRLRADAPETEIAWLRRGPSDPYELIPDDPLPARRELSEFGNAAARGEIPEIEPVQGTVRAIRDGDERPLAVELDRDGEDDVLEFDRLIANVGYRPDVDLFRELQTRECWATEGTIDLAASLMADDSADCLNQDVGGVELLEHPEPNFFVVGSKSYGRNSTFLLRDGFEQIRQVVATFGDA